MLHIEFIHSNADEPFRFEDTGAEIKLSLVREAIPESMFKSKEMLDFVSSTYNDSNIHLSYQNIAERAKEASENFDPEKVAYIFNDLVHVDEQLYYDIMNIIFNVIHSKDTCMAGEFARNLRITTDAEILSIMGGDKQSDDECSGHCDGCDGSCRHDNGLSEGDMEECENAVNKTKDEVFLPEEHE